MPILSQKIWETVLNKTAFHKKIKERRENLVFALFDGAPNEVEPFHPRSTCNMLRNQLSSSSKFKTCLKARKHWNNLFTSKFQDKRFLNKATLHATGWKARKSWMVNEVPNMNYLFTSNSGSCAVDKVGRGNCAVFGRPKFLINNVTQSRIP